MCPLGRGGGKGEKRKRSLQEDDKSRDTESKPNHIYQIIGVLEAAKNIDIKKSSKRGWLQCMLRMHTLI